MTQPPTSGPVPDPYGQQPAGPAQNPYGQPQPNAPQGHQGQSYAEYPGPQRHGGPQDPPPHQGPQGQGAPQGQFSPMGTVALTIQGSVMTSNMITPSIRINGHQIQTRYGRQDIPVPAGPVHVEGYAQWMRTYGQAAMDFTVEPGRTVPVFYAAPMHQFTTGSIGHEEQKRKGVGAFITIIAVVVGFTVLMIVLGALGAALS